MRSSLGERVFYVINYLLLALLGLTCLLPFIHIVAVSLSERGAVESGHVFLWPVGFQFTAYSFFFEGTPALRALKNSAIITIGGVLLSMAATILAAYPLSRPYLVGRRFMLLAMVFTMLFSGGIIPTYIVVKNLGLINSYWSLWLVGLVSTYNMLLMRSYFENIPREIDESARMDGSGEFTLLTRIILPLSMPIIATLALFYGVGYWNSFMHVLMYINQSDMQNFTVVVQAVLKSNDMLVNAANDMQDQQKLTNEMIRAVGVVFMVVPMLMIYPFLQKYFVKGVMLGSIKG
ncbi:ABC transporter permease [Paenibacillus sp. BIHB 4019]|uniref:ABC transporter permease n=1 Tax=Paenibacillus sp. BIHB 4019 TaxID=1870819 RepID=A0A1B2DDE1_9BACL|nr:carbohydrate ABC transporter permease [Paenibacillus sp. BIHB 4019]ANY65723.1 ABC transporter permease [Paenibacillus sp. BIHB 4019]